MNQPGGNGDPPPRRLKIVNPATSKASIHFKKWWCLNTTNHIESATFLKSHFKSHKDIAFHHGHSCISGEQVSLGIRLSRFVGESNLGTTWIMRGFLRKIWAKPVICKKWYLPTWESLSFKVSISKKIHICWNIIFQSVFLMPVEKKSAAPSEAWLVSLNFRHVDPRFEVFRKS